jgi:riboflavin synthase
MFTGLVQNLGKIVEIQKKEGFLTLGISSTLSEFVFNLGASIAVDGVCLTVEKFEKGIFWVTAVDETLNRTCLGVIRVGDRVHLEPALTLEDPLGGHLMSGHVDGFATVLQPAPRLRLELPTELLRFCPTKGSIAVLGVSLTIADAQENWIDLALIPETLRVTKLGELHPGDKVHVEVDMIARYLERLYAFDR